MKQVAKTKTRWAHTSWHPIKAFSADNWQRIIESLIALQELPPQHLYHEHTLFSSLSLCVVTKTIHHITRWLPKTNNYVSCGRAITAIIIPLMAAIAWWAYGSYVWFLPLPFDVYMPAYCWIVGTIWKGTTRRPIHSRGLNPQLFPWSAAKICSLVAARAHNIWYHWSSRRNRIWLWLTLLRKCRFPVPSWSPLLLLSHQ